MNKKKLGMTIGSLALVGAIAVGGTLAYLTDTSLQVKNTFTLTNDLDIILDEAPVNSNGQETNGTRVQENKYNNLYANQLLDKDPTVTLTNTSIDQYVFVVVKENSNVAVEKYNTVQNEGDWTEYNDANHTDVKIFYQLVDIDGENVDKVLNDSQEGYTQGIQLQPIFENVKVGDVTTATDNALGDILVGAATIQADGIEATADEKVNVAYNQISTGLLKLVGITG